jgi:BMFP domain-containing protein YqiC
MSDETSALLVRIGELEALLHALEAKVQEHLDYVDVDLVDPAQLRSRVSDLEAKAHDLEVELRGMDWGLSNASAEAHEIRHYDDGEPLDT